MARPSNDSLDYFSLDVVDADNLQYVEAIHNLVGYAVVHKLWKYVYGGPGGYYREFGEINQGMFCKNNAVERADLMAILETCFIPEISIFDREMFLKYKIITSRGIQKQWHKVVTAAGRKNTTITEEYRLIEIEEPKKIDKRKALILEVSSLGNQSSGVFSGEESTQSKVKESKVEESNSLSSSSIIHQSPFAPPSGAPPNIVGEGRENRVVEPFWKELCAAYSDFVLEQFGERPLFEGRDPKFLKAIVCKLKKRAARKKVVWDVVSGPQRLRDFLAHALADQWLAKNFILKNLDIQFEKIGRDLGRINNPPPAPVSSSVDEIEFLYGRFKEGSLRSTLITAPHFDFLAEQSKAVLTDEIMHLARAKRANFLTGTSNGPELRLLYAYMEGKTEENSEEIKLDKGKLLCQAKQIAVKLLFEKYNADGCSTIFSP